MPKSRGRRFGPVVSDKTPVAVLARTSCRLGIVAHVPLLELFSLATVPMMAYGVLTMGALACIYWFFRSEKISYS